ncbi:GDSL-type esterase/lipase family protein [Acidimicrobiales bacterium]|jgi:hypothetical protein|nr:GDSL-type esterase/lipase family protein [Acidimicrobiales bacterium]
MRRVVFSLTAVIFVATGLAVAPGVGAVDGPTTNDVMYAAFKSGVSLGGVSAADEDVLAWDGAVYSLVFDGSDVGLEALEIDALDVILPDQILMSFTTAGSVPGIGTVDDSDIVLFSGTLGAATAGTFSMYFDGSDVGLTRNGEDIDGLSLLDSGDLLISTSGSFKASGSTGQDEDVSRFSGSFGSTTSGTFSLHLDGSDLVLTDRREDIDGLSDDGDGLYFSPVGALSAGGVSGADEDIFRFSGSFGSNTSGSLSLHWDGSAEGTKVDMGALDIDVVDVPGEPTAVVTMGDSYISGEAGRWLGNWNDPFGDRGGTDRAAYTVLGIWQYDSSLVYGATAANGCHRSDVSEVLLSEIAVDSLVNLACSGAQTQNIPRSSNGGTGQGGEPSQADQLASVAASHDVEMIVLSIGGNDLGFADIIITCTVEYNTSPSWWPNTCNSEQQAAVNSRMGPAMAGVATAIDEIRAVMAASGQPDGYRLVLQSYPSPIPRSSEFRYSESGWDRTLVGGCPFWDVDADWARDSLVPQISSELAAVAASKNVEFLDLSDQLEDREVCSVHTSHGTGSNAEWARFLVTGLTQGDAQESMHPNAYGQQATGTCLGLLYTAAEGDYTCTNIAGASADTMLLSPG